MFLTVGCGSGLGDKNGMATINNFGRSSTYLTCFLSDDTSLVLGVSRSAIRLLSSVEGKKEDRREGWEIVAVRRGGGRCELSGSQEADFHRQEYATVYHTRNLSLNPASHLLIKYFVALEASIRTIPVASVKWWAPPSRAPRSSPLDWQPGHQTAITSNAILETPVSLA